MTSATLIEIIELSLTRQDHLVVISLDILVNCLSFALIHFVLDVARIVLKSVHLYTSGDFGVVVHQG